MKKAKKAFLLLYLAILFQISIFSQEVKVSFPDNFDIRNNFFSSVIGAPISIAKKFEEKTLNSSIAGPVLVRTRTEASSLFIEFLNKNGSNENFYNRGSVIIERSEKTSFIIEARILLADNFYSYLKFYPQGSLTKADLVLFGGVIKKGLNYSPLIYNILIKPFDYLIDYTNKLVDWKLVLETPNLAYLANLKELKKFSNLSTIQANKNSKNNIDDKKLASLPSFASTQDLSLSWLNPLKANQILQLSFSATSVDSLILSLAKIGLSDVKEFSSLNKLVPLALAQDTQVKSSKAPYMTYVKYEAGKGLIAKALASTLWLGYFENPRASYTIISDNTRALAFPNFDESGNPNILFLTSSGEKNIEEIVKNDVSFRIITIIQ